MKHDSAGNGDIRPSPILPVILRQAYIIDQMRFLLPLLGLIPTLALGDTMVPGMVITEYPRHDKQTDEYKTYIPIKEFGEPIGQKTVTGTVSPWKHKSERNAIVRGYLKIDKKGNYSFTTDSFYDRNLLMLDGKLVCGFADGGSKLVTVPLKKGFVEFVCAGYFGGRGASGINVRWRPPGAREVENIPADRLFHKADDLLANYVTVVAKDFVIDAYINGDLIPTSQRRMILDRFGSTVERISVKIRKGDWIVFNVTHNRLRHGGTKYFGAAGCLDKDRFGFVSDPASKNWTICDDPSQVADFISRPASEFGKRPSAISKKWGEGDGLMRHHAGGSFSGKPIWGAAPSTWIKYTAPPAPVGGIKVAALKKAEPAEKEKPAPKPEPKVEDTKKGTFRIISAKYGYGNKLADVTKRAGELLEKKFEAFTVGHEILGATTAKKRKKQTLYVIYIKNGMRHQKAWTDGESVNPKRF